MFIREAKAIAEDLMEKMRPYCERIEVGGSIRRGCQDVGDIEIVAVPKWVEGAPVNLLGDRERINLLYNWGNKTEKQGGILWIKPGTSEVIPWRIKPEGKYWRAQLPYGIKLDLFLTTLEQWGIIFLIRTGSAEFSQGVMTYAKLRTPLHVKDGELRDQKERALETFEEEDAFGALWLDYVEPSDRTGFQAVKVKGQPVFPANYGIRNMERLK
jgi:DNA polymerase/3'-5' exonuclease PolX